MTNASHNFWAFSLRIYQDSEVALACLGLQNGYGLDVNLLLFCCWHGTKHGEIPPLLLEKAYKHSIIWRENVVQPLRNSRTWMKSNSDSSLVASSEFETLRQQIKTLELRAEETQQHALEAMVQAPPYVGTGEETEKVVRHNLEQLVAMHSASPFSELNNQPEPNEIPQLDDLLQVLIRATVRPSVT